MSDKEKEGQSHVTAAIIVGVFTVIAAIIGGVFIIVNTLVQQATVFPTLEAATAIVTKATPVVAETPAVQPETAPGTACVVPNVVELNELAAENIIARLGLQSVKSVQYNSKAKAGVVLSQDPPGDTTIDPCIGDILIVVSLGPTPTPVLPTDTPTLSSTKTPTPTNTPTPTAKPPTCSIGETVIAPFTGGIYAVRTSNAYQGTIIITVSGTGQAAGTQYSDAFYMLANDNQVDPEHLGGDGWVLRINGQFARELISDQQKPTYRSDHVYTFQVNAPGGTLTFGVSDIYTSDNTGSYTVVICKP